MKDKFSDSTGQFNFESATNQRELLLAQLKKRPVTTLQARQWGIMSPAARIMELRQEGHEIATRKAKVSTGNCIKPVAEYVLVDQAKTESKE